MPEVKELKELNVAGSATSKDMARDFFVQWHLTERCNLACCHCYQSGVTGAEMDLRSIRETAGEVSDMVKDWAERYGILFTPSFTITGGEPFLRSDLFQILPLLAAQGFETYLLTNGTLIDRRKAQQLEGCVHGVQVSVEGPETVHDSIRGKGAFRRAVAGVEAMVSRNIPVSLNVTMSRLNVNYLAGIVALGKELGVYRVGFSRLVPRGKGAGLAEMMLTPDEVRDVYRSLFLLRGDALEVVSGDPLADSLEPDSDGYEDRGDTAYGGCAAGISGLTLMPDGTITPCRRLPIPIGNVMKDSLREVWAESRVLNQLRNRSAYAGKCGSCPRWATCRGCRAIAHACGGAVGHDAFLGDDPQCFLS
jgi:radical SAM protein with 4Fe4S-binding SPASM domain